MAQGSRNGKTLGILAAAALIVMGAYAYRVLPEYFAGQAAPEKAPAPAEPAAASDDYFLGDAAAPKAGTIIEYGDYECPYCSTAGAQAASLIAGHPHAKLVWKDCPLPNHPNAFDAAVAARCAGEQGKFWSYHDLLAAASDSLGPDLYSSAAQGLGLDMARFAACRADGAQAARTRSSLAACADAGVRELPWFYLNGRTYSGGNAVNDLGAALP